METDIILVSKTFAQDEIGQPIPIEHNTDPIPAQKMSVTRSEFYESSRSGLRAEYVYITPAINYSGEETLIEAGVRYTIYRTYRDAESEDIELYARKEIGA